MGLLLLGLCLGIIGEVFLFKIYALGGKQFAKYDEQNSTLLFIDATSFIARINTLSIVGVSCVQATSNEIALNYQSNAYTVKIEGGRAYIKYDTAGCGLKLSSIGKILRMSAFIKATKKAIAINTLMDQISGNATKDSVIASEKLKKHTRVMVVCIIAMILSVVIGCISFTKNTVHQETITNVQTSLYYGNLSYGEIIDAYLIDPQWTTFNSETDTPVVEVNGISVNGEQICIQFVGELGMGFNQIATQDFELYYFGVDGETVDPDYAMEYICGFISNRP